HIGRSMLFGYSRVHGQLRLPGTTVNGMALFTGTQITDAEATAFEGEALTIKGDGFFNNGFKAEGTVSLVGATFGGVLTFRGAHLATINDNPALHCGGMQVSRGLYLTHGFHASGEVRLIGVTIGGHLDLVGMA